MAHSISNSFGVGRVYLVIDQRRSDLSDPSTRRALIQLDDNLIELGWSYNCARGGFGQATALAQVPEGSWARRQIEARNYSTAYIYYAPPETEGAVLITDYDNNEGELLLWSGLVSNMEVSPRSNTVSITLDGLGDMTAKVTATRENFFLGVDTIEANVISMASAVGLSSWILPNPPLSANKRILSDGAMLRKVRYNEGWSPDSSHLDNFANLLGGHPKAAWGVVNAGGADDGGQLYFSLVSDPMREQTSTDSEFNNRSTPMISTTEIARISVESDSSQIINYARVFKPLSSSDDIYMDDGIASNAVSIARIGRRESILSDSSATDQSQLAERASEIVASRGNLEVSVVVDVVHDPRPLDYPDASGGNYLPLISALKLGTVKIPVPFAEISEHTQSGRGDCSTSVFEPEDSSTVSLLRDSVNGAVLASDCRDSGSSNIPSAPVGVYSASPLMYEGGDMDACAMFWSFQNRWTNSGELGDGSGANNSVALCEWDRQFYISLEGQGTTPQTYLPSLRYRNSSNNWASASAFTVSYGTIITKAQLVGGINFVIAAYTAVMGGGTDKADTFALNAYLLSGNKDDPSGFRTLIWSGSVGVSSITAAGNMSTEGKRVFFVNKMEGTGLSPLGRSNFQSLSRSVDVAGVSVYSSLGELNDAGTAHSIAGLSVVNFMPELPYQDPPYKFGKYQTLDVQLGVARDPEAGESFDSFTQSVIWTSYINMAGVGISSDGGFFTQLSSDTTGSGMSSNTHQHLRKHNIWLLGSGESGYGSTLGGSLSLAPRLANFSWRGGKIAITIEGNARPYSATYAIEEASEEISEALRNQKQGELGN